MGSSFPLPNLPLLSSPAPSFHPPRHHAPYLTIQRSKCQRQLQLWPKRYPNSCCLASAGKQRRPCPHQPRGSWAESRRGPLALGNDKDSEPHTTTTPPPRRRHDPKSPHATRARSYRGPRSTPQRPCRATTTLTRCGSCSASRMRASPRSSPWP